MSETITPVAAEPVVAPVAAPIGAPESAPVAETLSNGGAAASPDGGVAPASPPAAEPIAAPVPSTVLGDALKPAPVTPVAPVEAAPLAPAEPAKVEGQSDEPAPPPTYEPFTVPDGVTLQPERLGDFTSLLGEFEGQSKADHAAVQAFGQKLVERHVAEVQRTLADVQKLNDAKWDRQKMAWHDEFMADPEIGGNRFQTSVDSAIQFIRTHGGSDEQQAEIRQLMNDSGIGNHPAMIRLLAKAGMAMSEGRPLAGRMPAAPPKSNTQKMYGRS